MFQLLAGLRARFSFMGKGKHMDKVKVFLLGLLAAIGLMVIMGAWSGSEVGRYQITTITGGSYVWSVHVLDTKTGAVKIVSMKNKDFETHQLGKPFQEMEGYPPPR